MAESDSCKTQRDVGIHAVMELSAVGFEDAEEVGRGGLGVVYRCTQIGLDRTVAVKVLTGGLEENRERFFREQRAMMRLTGHPNIVGVLKVGETESGRLYLAMPYHRRGSLDARIRGGGPLSVEEVLRVGVRLAGALEVAHRAGVLHRDIKPANILLTDYDELALTDFGIARIADAFETETGVVTGSPAFTAPEMLGGDGASRAADVYGLGATLFCALTGHAAFERHSEEQVTAQFLRITTQPVPDLRESGFPEDLSAVIEAAMSRDLHERPTAAVLGEQLQRVQLAHGFGVEQMALRAERPGKQKADRMTVEAERRRGRSRLSGSLSRRAVGNLPLDLTSFVGRRTQVSEVKNVLARSRLMTLTGLGGVGKTRLALQVAGKLQQGSPDGAWLIELGKLRDPTLLADAVCTTLGLRNQAGRPMLDVLTEFLSAREVLLVLDNCEQVVDAAAQLVEALLRACPELRVLATSRESLGIGGESVYPVSPLDVPDLESKLSLRSLARYDAVTLFVERAAAAVPGFELTEDNWLDVAKICARLEGLPLAIELAAARLRAMSVRQILARLDDRYALLTRGSRGAPTRQQTLRWCIGWSYDLCTPVEQRLWERLAVFASTFELDAAEKICGNGTAETELLDALSALVEKSIVIREDADGAARFRMLETVQEYGRDRLEAAGEYPELCRRHRDWYEWLALEADAQWIGPRQLEWIARLEQELPNLRKALEFSRSHADESGLRIAAALYSFWILRGRLAEGRRWCDRVLSDSSGGLSADRAKVLYAASLLAAIQGDLADATGRVAELRTLVEQTPDAMSIALLANADGYIALVRGDLAHASNRIAEAVEIFDTWGELSVHRLTMHMRALITLGWAHEIQGDTARGLACLEKALAVSESRGDAVFRSYALWATGFGMWRRGDYDRAAYALEEAVRLSRMVADPLVAAGCSEMLAWVAAKERDVRRAAVLLGTAEGLGRMAGGSSILFRSLLVYHEECERGVREALGVGVYRASRQAGIAMSFDAAVRFVLGEQPQAGAPADRLSSSLTKREREVANLVVEGLTNKAIAARLVISLRTANGHVEHILAKLGFTSRTQIAAWAVEQTHDKPQ
ncbi:protein kinase [Nocardia sp. NPDC047038]|uniref:protein kinase domain-containing protein n=1 Tax=Nocardia sp. NPDC047038 TaxID=3154338 RepID=UPI00340F0DFE